MSKGHILASQGDRTYLFWAMVLPLGPDRAGFHTSTWRMKVGQEAGSALGPEGVGLGASEGKQVFKALCSAH